MEERNITIRKMRSEDKEELSLLYDRVWPEQAGRHFNKTSWAIDTSDYPGICAVDGDLIIGSRACFRSNLYYGEKKLESVQFGDSCVDANYRRLGLFTKMNNVFLYDFFRSGDEVIYNVSVDASRKAYEKLGWVYLHSLSNLFYFPYPFRFILKTKGRISSLSGFFKSDTFPIPDVDLIPNHLLLKREEMMVSRKLLHNRYDADTIRWRVAVDSNIQLLIVPGVGACLYKTGIKNSLRFCVLGEMFLEEYTYRCFKKMYRAILGTDRYDVISVSITHAHPLFVFYRLSGFLSNPKRPFLNLGVKSAYTKMRNVYLDPKKWALTEIDLDTF